MGQYVREIALLTSPGGVPPGTIIMNRYEVVRRLGSGASGTVYACVDKSLGRLKVAMKIFPPDILDDPLAASRLQREILGLNAVDHQNVARFYECIHEADFIAYTMESIEGENLADFMDRHKKLSLDVVYQLMVQIAAGLHAIHTKGLIHRDLKPANILITHNGIVKITDFGLARSSKEIVPGESNTPGVILSQQGRPTKATAHGAVVGTADYVSPEYLSEGTFDRRADIYALGVIAYELITKRLPYEAETLAALIVSKVERDPVAPHLVRPDCGVALSEVVIKSMHRNVHLRYQTTESLRNDLLALQAQRGNTLNHASFMNQMDQSLLDVDDGSNTHPVVRFFRFFLQLIRRFFKGFDTRLIIWGEFISHPFSMLLSILVLSLLILSFKYNLGDLLRIIVNYDM